MVRRGRKPHKGPREPGGRKSRKAEHVAEDAKSVVLEARERQLGVSRTTADNELMGTLIGRLRLGMHHTREDGQPIIGEDQHDAAIWFLTRQNDYWCSINADRAVYDRSGLPSGDPEGNAEFCRLAKSRWDAIQDALVNAQGESRVRALRYALDCFLNEEKIAHAYFGDLLIALNAIHKLRTAGRKRSLVA